MNEHNLIFKVKSHIFEFSRIHRKENTCCDLRKVAFTHQELFTRQKRIISQSRFVLFYQGSQSLAGRELLTAYANGARTTLAPDVNTALGRGVGTNLQSL